MILPDVNVWVALTFDSHIHHPAAKAWFDGLGEDVGCFCRLTQQGFLRLASNPQVVGVHAVTLSEAWRLYDSYLTDPRVTFAGEPIGLEARWRAFTARQSFSPHVWNDAYLAAFALAAGFDLVTLDQGFRQYPGVTCAILT